MTQQRQNETNLWPTRSGDEWVALDKQHIWHPFTQMSVWQRESPLVIDRAEGAFLYDVDGNRYIDGHSSLWVNVHGHAHPRIVEAIQQQVTRLDHSTMLGLANTPAIEFAKRLKAHLPEHLTRVFYSDSGATSVEIALKIAFQYQQLRGQGQRRKFICFKEAYHGDTIGSVSVGGMDLFHEIFRPLLFDAVHVDFPYPYRDEQNLDDVDAVAARCLQQIEDALKAHGDTVAAVVAEPGVQGAAGMRMAPIGYMKRVEELCRKYDVLLILDEVATGFGRTGKMFARDHEDVNPDLMCMAKGISGGVLPLAVTATSETIYEAFLAPYEEMKQFFHGHSYTGNPIACAAAIASLDIFEQDGILDALPAKVDTFAHLLDEHFGEHPHVGEIRQRGLMVGIELVKDQQSRDVWEAAEMTPQKIVEAARRMGAVIRPLGNVMILMPPLCIDDATLAELVQITRDAVDEVLS